MEWIRIAAAFGFLGVALGAFGAHGLRQRLESGGFASQYETGVHYHLIHVAALLATGLLARMGGPGPSLSAAGWCFLSGIVLFSGSLYALGLTGQRWLGAVTPAGGLLLLAGWVCLFVAARSKG